MYIQDRGVTYLEEAIYKYIILIGFVRYAHIYQAAYLYECAQLFFLKYLFQLNTTQKF